MIAFQKSLKYIYGVFNFSPSDTEAILTPKVETPSEGSKFITKDDSWILNSNHLNRSRSGPDCVGRNRDSQSPEFDRSSVASFDSSTMSESQEEVIRRPKGSTAIRRRPGKRLSRSKVKRRCSINGHFYDRDTSFFTPPHGSQMSVWITSLVNTQDVINLILEKYKVESDPVNFALFMIRDNGGEFEDHHIHVKDLFEMQELQSLLNTNLVCEKA